MGTKTTIQQAPTTPAPPAEESAAGLYEARLKYDEPIAAMEQALMNQYYPQQAQLQSQLYQQYAPQMAEQQQSLQEQYAPRQQQLQQSMFPQQTQLVEAMAGQALNKMGATSPLVNQMEQQASQRLQSPLGYSPQEQAALDAIRGRQREQLTEDIRTRANLGGGLFGGRAAGREEQAQTELGQSFAQQDMARMLAGQQQAWGQAAQVPGLQQGQSRDALAYATPIAQILYPQINAPQGPQTQAPIQQQVTPSADALYNAMFQASQPQSFAQNRQGFMSSYIM